MPSPPSTPTMGDGRGSAIISKGGPGNSPKPSIIEQQKSYKDNFDPKKGLNSR